jgi:glycine dehydrogenase subunit 1
MPYTCHTDEDRKAMLESIALRSEKELFEQIPSELYLSEPLPIGAGKTEPEVLKLFTKLAHMNDPATGLVNFLGGGVYDHVVPPVVKNLGSRPEFVTAYTPYQPEVSQGTLQVIFEFQTHVSRLTGMPIANASMYDAASALAEAVLMASKVTRRNKVLYPANLNPRYMEVVKCYVAGQEIELEQIPYDAAGGDIDAASLLPRLDKDTAGVLVQTPNYFGVLEQPWSFVKDVHANGSLLVAAVDPISLSIFQPPGAYEADIVVGEGQSLGNDVNFGGPLLGFIACSQKLIRQMPGRIVSATKDIEGKDAFVLTLQTREQHIRREKATSNICTNQGLMATRATIYLSLLGEGGFVELGRVCHANARRLAEMIGAVPGYELRFNGPFFREFVVDCPTDAAGLVLAARQEGILAGIPLAKYYGDEAKSQILMAVTEKHDEADFEKFCGVLRNL